MSQKGVFSGLKVIDLSGGVAGPLCAMMLAQHGANVIKVETPDGGDWSRILGKKYGDHTAYSVFATLGKRSVALDLKTEKGKAILWQLLKGADVFIEGFRPGTIQRLGFGSEAVRAREPQILYYSMSGFGQTGPLAERPAMDPILQAFTGIMNENRGEFDGHPHRVAVSMIDMFTGLLGFQAVAMTLIQQQGQSNRGGYLDLSLMHGASMLAATTMIGGYLEGGIAARSGYPNGVYNTSDGRIAFNMVRPKDWALFCDALERPDLAIDPRYMSAAEREKNLAAVADMLRPILAEKPTAWLMKRLTERGIMNTKVNSYTEFLEEEQVRATGVIAWLEQPGIPRKIPMANIPGLPPLESGTRRAHAPMLGEHTVEVLRENGFLQAEINTFLAQAIVAAPRATSA
ncbi:CaiB/BaiF CoA transferase family protein [Ferrovibrio sp.]|uniref:CaiB/BaiF CoA transferase family protein n=1 Tax=Ferrovibrio sp. TaxID=1917215 RepID=UPI003D2B7445